jgi:hypothetical protein
MSHQQRIGTPGVDSEGCQRLEEAGVDVACRLESSDPGLAVPCEYALPARTLALLAELVGAARAAKGATTEAA